MSHNQHSESSMLDRTLRMVYLNCPVPYCVKDRELKYVSCNYAFEALHGLSADQLIGKTAVEAFGESGQMDLDMDERAVLSLDSISYETVVVDPSLELVEVDVTKTVLRDEKSGKFEGLCCFYRDRTHYNKIDRELLRARVVMDSAQDLFIVIDRERMEIIDCNRRVVEVLGYPRSEMIESDPCSIMPQITESKFSEFLSASSSDEETLETLIMKSDGDVFEAQMELNPVNSDVEDLFVIAIRDISKRKKSEKELKVANRTLRLIGTVNKALIKAETEYELLSTVCDEIVNIGKYSAVFSLVCASKESGISAVYQNSQCEMDIISCLNELSISAIEREEILKIELEGSVIRSASARMESIPGNLPKWIVPKFSACMVVPTNDGENVRTALVIFAKESNAFDGPEAELLRELGDEIAYGVKSLRQKQARKEAEQRVAKQLEVEKTIATFSSSLLSSETLASGIRKAIPNLLEVTEADQIFLYEISGYENGSPVARRTCEFKRHDCQAESIAPPKLDLDKDLHRWHRLLASRKPIECRASELPEEEREVFHFGDSAKILILPLYSRKTWIGFLGLNLREQTNEEFDAKRELVSIATEMLAEQYMRQRSDLHMKMLASAINSSDEGVIISTVEDSLSDSSIVFANDGLCRMTGYSKDQLVNRSASFIQAKSMPEEAEMSLIKYLQKGQSHVDEFLAVRMDGTAFNCERKVYPIVDDEGSLSSYLSIISDTTEKKELETRVSFANKMESIGQLSAGIAHEINTPSQFIGDNLSFLDDAWGKLNPLLEAFCQCENFEEIVDQSGASSRLNSKRLNRILSNIPEAISDANEGVERISTIVKAMREFSHPEKSMSLTNINKCITTTVTVARNEWKYICDLTTNLDEQLPLVECMPGDINQVILNLIVNASHAIEDMKAKGLEEGKIHIETKQAEGFAYITIEDTGGGIPESIGKSIFDPFFTTKEVGKGTGQGLFMAHTIIVQNHGGKLWFDSEVGVGTTFHIELPFSAKKEEVYEEG